MYSTRSTPPVTPQTFWGNYPIFELSFQAKKYTFIMTCGWYLADVPHFHICL